MYVYSASVVFQWGGGGGVLGNDFILKTILIF